MTLNPNMIYQAQGFTFYHVREYTWAVKFNGKHFAYVSQDAVARVIKDFAGGPV